MTLRDFSKSWLALDRDIRFRDYGRVVVVPQVGPPLVLLHKHCCEARRLRPSAHLEWIRQWCGERKSGRIA